MLLFSSGRPFYVLAQFPASWRGICVQKPKRNHYEQGVIFEIMLNNFFKSWLCLTFLLLIHKSNLTASFSMMIYFFITKGTRNERRILASTRHSEFQKYQPGITVRSSRSIKRLQSDEEDKVRAVISLGSLTREANL